MEANQQQKEMENHFFLDSFTKKVCEELSAKVKQCFDTAFSAYEIGRVLTSPPPPTKQKSSEEKKKNTSRKVLETPLVTKPAKAKKSLPALGHWAFPCFILSKKLKKKPAEVAHLLAESFDSSSEVFEKAVNTGPYVNLFFKKPFLKAFLLEPLKSKELFKVPSKKMGSYLIEYSQPNTHKELHIGHTRNLCFGLGLVTLLKKRAFSVVTCTYPGDMGTHTAKCLWYLKYHNKEPVPSQNKGQWLGNIYTQACQLLEQTKEPEKKEEKKKQLAEILHCLQKKEGEFYRLWKETRLWSKALMDEVYDWAGAKFDYWYWESEVDKPSVEWVQKLYKEKKLELSDSAVGMDLGGHLGFCLLLKSDGNGLYATKDLYLLRKKFEDHKPTKNIYIVDQRQNTHFQQVFKVMENLGYAKEASQSFHLSYNFVELKTGVISSRLGKIVPVNQLIEEMTNYIEKTFLEKYKGEWSKEKIQSTAYQIAQGAIKFGMNDQDLNKKIVFDMKEWLSLEGRSGPYIQYAYARACSLLKKLGGGGTAGSAGIAYQQASSPKESQSAVIPPLVNSPRGLRPSQSEGGSATLAGYQQASSPKESQSAVKASWVSEPRSGLSDVEEWDLVLYLSWFSLEMEKCAWRMSTAPICRYLFELAQKFSRFYQNCPIGSLEEGDKKQFRLLLVQATQKTLEEGLSYLTIPTPKQM